MTTDQAVRAYILAESDRRDRELQTRLNAWKEGWRACEQALADTWEEGFTAGLMTLKAAQHDIFRALQVDGIRWGPGGREHFADARPGDYMGGPVPAW